MGLKDIAPTSVMYPNEIALRNINQVVNVENKLCLSLTVQSEQLDGLQPPGSGEDSTPELLSSDPPIVFD